MSNQRLLIEFSPEEWANLQKLADYRKCAVATCIKDFARHAMPGGSDPLIIAAREKTLDKEGLRKCEFCGLSTNGKVRLCCDRGRMKDTGTAR